MHPLNNLSIAYKKLTKEFEHKHNVDGSLLGPESTLVTLNIYKMR